MFGPMPSRRRRILYAVGVLVVNLIMWVVIPYYLGTLLAGVAPGSPLTVPFFVYEFGILITALQVGAALTEGHFLWVPFTSATAIAIGIYLWEITDGGVLKLAVQNSGVVLDFQVILYLIELATLWPAVRAPLSYLLYRREERISGSPVDASLNQPEGPAVQD